MMKALPSKCNRTEGRFLDASGNPPESCNTQWAPIIMTKEQIDQEVERLLAIPKVENGRRESLIVHPNAMSNTPSMTPGIQVRLSVLAPGEKTLPFRHNATEVNFCVRGGGRCRIADRDIGFEQYDVWNHPSFTYYSHENNRNDLQVRLTYSNVPLLQFMDVYITDSEEATVAAPAVDNGEDPRRRNPFGTFPISDDGGMLMPYETLINPTPVNSTSLHFPWGKVKPELDKLESLGDDYAGRRLYMYYNPATGRFNGITPSFFATMTMRPPRVIDKPHRHVSAAINYYFSGSGYSVVDGSRYEWKAGDLMLSAPGWAVHNHASYDEHVYELTVQDQPLNIFMESLLWQEDLHHPAIVLGRQQGFVTNRTREPETG